MPGAHGGGSWHQLGGRAGWQGDNGWQPRQAAGRRLGAQITQLSGWERGSACSQGTLPRPRRQHHLCCSARALPPSEEALSSLLIPPHHLLTARSVLGPGWEDSRFLWASEALPVGEVMAGWVTGTVTKGKSCSPPHPVLPPDQGLAHTKGKVS